MGLEFRGRVTFPGQQLARTKSGTWPKFSWKYPKNDLIRETRTEARNLKHNSRKDGLLSSCLMLPAKIRATWENGKGNSQDYS